MELTAEQIQDINDKAPMEWQENEQGVFIQPYGIPDNTEGYVIYMRWMSGGISGGSCWDDSDPQPFTVERTPPFVALDLVLKELCPDISYLRFKEIEDNLIHSSEETEWEYYGNCTEFSIKYVLLSDLVELLKTSKEE